MIDYTEVGADNQKMRECAIKALQQFIEQESFRYLERNKMCRYVVTKWCCTSGQCGKCCYLSFGKRVRTVAVCTDNVEVALSVEKNWREFEPQLIDREKTPWTPLQLTYFR